jgi:hypothetical protein
LPQGFPRVRRDFTKGIKSSACRLNHITGIASGDRLRHNAAAGIPEANEENVGFLLFHPNFNL